MKTRRARIRKQEKALKMLWGAMNALETIPTRKSQTFADRIRKVADDLSFDITADEMGSKE